MAWWNDEPRWVSDEGVRCYLADSDRGGPSRLECYRRLLATSAEVSSPESVDQHSPDRLAWGFTDVVELAKGGWRRYPGAIATVLHIVGQ